MRISCQARPWGLSTALWLAVATQPALAFPFTEDEGRVEGNFDTTISVGALWRTQDRDPALVGLANGGLSRTVNDDDGNLNYDRGDLVSFLTKVTHELDLRQENSGLFGRFYYFYDAAVDNKSGLPDATRRRLVSDIELLDLFVHGRGETSDGQWNGRFGNQVLNWGESTFIPNGINVINPVDLSRLRSPGSELREALLPVPMIWGSLDTDSGVSLEAFYQVAWKKLRIDPAGSFFSFTDALSDGGDRIYTGYGRRDDQHAPPALPVGATAATAQVWIPRLPDIAPSNGGEYGLSAHAPIPALNDLDLGFYYVNYHSRTPFLSTVAGSPSSYAATGTAWYQAEYPENIHLYGASFNTSLPGGIALQGEYSYRPNQPLQLSGTEVVLATFGLKNGITGDTRLPPGTPIAGYRRVGMHQAQASATKVFSQVLGADQWVMLGEVGYTHLNLPDGLYFNGPGANLAPPGSDSAGAFGSEQGSQGYATPNSWGYRLLLQGDYANAWRGINLHPRVAFGHDVSGVGPTFNEGTKALTLGLGLTYRQKWQADLSWTGYFGGRTYTGTDPGMTPALQAAMGQPANYASSANPLKDRDFLALSLSYSF